MKTLLLLIPMLLFTGLVSAQNTANNQAASAKEVLPNGVNQGEPVAAVLARANIDKNGRLVISTKDNTIKLFNRTNGYTYNIAVPVPTGNVTAAFPIGGGTFVTTPTTRVWRFTGTTYHVDLTQAQPTVGDAVVTLPDTAGVADTVALLTKVQTFVGAKTFTAAATFSSTASFVGAVTPTGGVAASGGFTVSPRSVNTGGREAITAADGNDSTPSTTETYCSEIFIPANCTVTGVALFNGSDVTGNVTVGLADSTGAPITAAKSASTAGSGTDAYQRVPFAVAYAAKGPATYYIQVQYSSATARYNTFAVGNHGVQKQTSQTYGTLASFTPSGTFVTNIGNIAGLY